MSPNAPGRIVSSVALAKLAALRDKLAKRLEALPPPPHPPALASQSAPREMAASQLQGRSQGEAGAAAAGAAGVGEGGDARGRPAGGRGLGPAAHAQPGAGVAIVAPLSLLRGGGSAEPLRRHLNADAACPRAAGAAHADRLPAHTAPDPVTWPAPSSAGGGGHAPDAMEGAVAPHAGEEHENADARHPAPRHVGVLSSGRCEFAPPDFEECQDLHEFLEGLLGDASHDAPPPRPGASPIPFAPRHLQPCLYICIPCGERAACGVHASCGNVESERNLTLHSRRAPGRESVCAAAGAARAATAATAATAVGGAGAPRRPVAPLSLHAAPASSASAGSAAPLSLLQTGVDKQEEEEEEEEEQRRRWLAAASPEALAASILTDCGRGRGEGEEVGRAAAGGDEELRVGAQVAASVARLVCEGKLDVIEAALAQVLLLLQTTHGGRANLLLLHIFTTAFSAAPASSHEQGCEKSGPGFPPAEGEPGAAGQREAAVVRETTMCNVRHVMRALCRAPAVLHAGEWRQVSLIACAPTTSLARPWPPCGSAAADQRRPAEQEGSRSWKRSRARRRCTPARQRRAPGASLARSPAQAVRALLKHAWKAWAWQALLEAWGLGP